VDEAAKEARVAVAVAVIKGRVYRTPWSGTIRAKEKGTYHRR
jgi:hypothetical protein